MNVETNKTSARWDAPALLVALTAASFLFRFVTGQVAFGFIGIIASAIAVVLLHREMIGGLRAFPWLVAGLAATMLLALYNAPESAYRSLYYGVAGALLICTGYHLSNRRDGAAIVISAAALFVLFAIVLAMMPFKGVNPEAFNYYFPNTSRNGISATLIFTQVFYSVAYYVRLGRPPLVTPVVTFLLCVLLYGRSGTLFSYALVVVSCLAAYRPQRMLAITGLVACTAVMAIVLSPAVTGSMQNTLELVIQKIPIQKAPTQGTSSRGAGAPLVSPEPQVETPSPSAGAPLVSPEPQVETPLPVPSDQPKPELSEWRMGLYSLRTLMIEEYLLSLQPSDWLLGGSLAASPTIAEYNLNPHNAFIRGHAYFGMPYLLLIGAMLFHALYEGVRQREWFMPAVMLIFAGRAFFDISGLFDLFDVGFFFAYFAIVRGLKLDPFSNGSSSFVNTGEKVHQIPV